MVSTYINRPRRFFHKRSRRVNPYFQNNRPNQAPKRQRLQPYLFVFALAGIIGALVFFFSYSGLKVSSVTVESNSDVAVELIANTTDQYLSAGRFIFFKNNNYLLLHEDRLEKLIQDKLRNSVSLETIKVNKELPKSLTITANVRTPSILYSSKDGQYLLDQSAIVALRYVPPTEDSANEANILPKLVDNNTNRLTNIGEAVTSAEFIEALQLVAYEAPLREINIDQFEIPEIFCPTPQAVIEPAEEGSEEATTNTNSTDLINTSTNSSLQVNINVKVEPDCVREDLILANTQLRAKLTDGPLVYFTLHNDLNPQLEALELFLSDKRGEIGLMSYIDVRFPDHVYYQ